MRQGGDCSHPLGLTPVVFRQSGLEMCRVQKLIQRVYGPAKGVCRRMFRYGSVVGFLTEKNKGVKGLFVSSR